MLHRRLFLTPRCLPFSSPGSKFSSSIQPIPVALLHLAKTLSGSPEQVHPVRITAAVLHPETVASGTELLRSMTSILTSLLTRPRRRMLTTKPSPRQYGKVLVAAILAAHPTIWLGIVQKHVCALTAAVLATCAVIVLSLLAQILLSVLVIELLLRQGFLPRSVRRPRHPMPQK